MIELLALIGFTLIVVRATILMKLRALWPGLLGCSQCVGFWTGVFAAAIRSHEGYTAISGALASGCVVSLCAMTADIVLLKLAGGEKS